MVISQCQKWKSLIIGGFIFLFLVISFILVTLKTDTILKNEDFELKAGIFLSSDRGIIVQINLNIAPLISELISLNDIACICLNLQANIHSKHIKLKGLLASTKLKYIIMDLWHWIKD
jgi:hypothetical protein